VQNVIDTAQGLYVIEFNGMRTRVAAEVASSINSHISIMDEVNPELSFLTESLSQMMAGGKRLRPAFAYWGFRAAGGQDCEEILKAATALEFLQACALIHDDVMDESDTRRGNPSSHRQFEALHKQNGWLGDAKQFGIGGAILLGDLCLSWADELLMNSGFENSKMKSAKDLYDLMRTELLAGQYLDLLEQAKSNASIDNIMQVITYKSAKYTIERPLHMGALLAGADSRTVQTLSDYGLPLGIAFQLRDDILGVFGDEKVTGKPAGDDLREGKRTVLVATALSKTSGADHELLKNSLGDKNLSAETISKLQEILNKSGAVDEVEQIIEKNRTIALEAINREYIDEEAVFVLSNLAIAATERNF
jgi:geranylgeranyl diphosphate synthase type I